MARRSRAQAHRQRAKARAFRFGAACGGAPGLLHVIGTPITSYENNLAMLGAMMTPGCAQADESMMIIPTKIPNPSSEYALTSVIGARLALHPLPTPPPRVRGPLMLCDTMAIDTTYRIKFARRQHPGYVQLTPVDIRVDLDLPTKTPIISKSPTPLAIADRPYDMDTHSQLCDPLGMAVEAERSEDEEEEVMISLALEYDVPVTIVWAMWDTILSSTTLTMRPDEYIDYVQEETFGATSNEEFWNRSAPPLGFSQLVALLTKYGNPAQLPGLA